MSAALERSFPRPRTSPRTETTSRKRSQKKEFRSSGVQDKKRTGSGALWSGSKPILNSRTPATAELLQDMPCRCSG